MASLSLNPTHVNEDALSNCEDSVRCKCTALIASHRKHLQGNSGLPTSSFSSLPLPPFLCLHSCKTQQGWRQLRDEHVWTPQCSREDPPKLEVEGDSATENCPVHCMFFSVHVVLLQTLSTDGLFLLRFSMCFCMGEVGITQPSLIVVTLVLSF